MPCLGLFADVEYVNDSPKKKTKLGGAKDGGKFFELLDAYKEFKGSYAKHIMFSPDSGQEHFGRIIKIQKYI